MAHTAATAIRLIKQDIQSYISGEVDPDLDSHEATLDNILLIEEAFQKVSRLGAAIERGDQQAIADIWLGLKSKQMAVQNTDVFVAIRDAGETDVVVFNDQRECLRFCEKHPEYRDIQSGIFDTADQALEEIFGEGAESSPAAT